jgi:hypothetical protein
MSAKILTDRDGQSCLYCSTTETAFGPVFYAHEDAQDFLSWLKMDPRILSNEELSLKVAQWRRAAE